jgi:hypothetical protein
VHGVSLGTLRLCVCFFLSFEVLKFDFIKKTIKKLHLCVDHFQVYEGGLRIYSLESFLS